MYFCILYFEVLECLDAIFLYLLTFRIRYNVTNACDFWGPFCGGACLMFCSGERVKCTQHLKTSSAWRVAIPVLQFVHCMSIRTQTPLYSQFACQYHCSTYAMVIARSIYIFRHCSFEIRWRQEGVEGTHVPSPSSKLIEIDGNVRKCFSGIIRNWSSKSNLEQG